MPELPEVEHAVRRLRGWIATRAIVRAEAHHKAIRRTLTPRRLASLQGRAVRDVSRRGKHQFVHLDDARVLHVHFRMNGDWAWVAPGADAPRHVRLTLHLDDGARVVLTDSRALATAVLLDDVAPVLAELGPEADDPALTPRAFHAMLAGKRTPIKVALLDQRLLAGVGNIYATEGLWHARVDPRVAAGALTLAQARAVLTGVRKALGRGMRREGRYAEGDSHEFLVYDREGAPCRHRDGGTIRRIVQGGRSTYHCPRCQRR
ncbi:MAG: DNA-formamidopyrimidine glycosylase [Gemmatimonadetes bacterium]|nr:DNA-formamidopyrimidine glycosylase [Gemmatimonadota bacterium]